MLRREQCILRPLTPDDRDLLYRWRNSDRIRAVMFKKSLIPRPEHDLWFSRTLADRDSCYLIFLLSDRPCGLVNFPHINRSSGICRWGFYLGESGLPQGAGSAMGYLGLEQGFSELQLQTVIGETLLENARGIRFHERLRFERQAELKPRPSSDLQDGVVEFQMHRRRWGSVRRELESSIFYPEGGHP